MAGEIDPAALRLQLERGDDLLADLLVGAAPVTCRTICDALPIEGIVINGRYSGTELSLDIVAGASLRRENQAMYFSSGDILVWRQWEGQYEPGGSCCIALFYAPSASRDWMGAGPGNLFARVRPAYLGALADIGRRVWTHGRERIRISAFG